MSEELKVTKERVLEAAKLCPTASEVLKGLFPEAFDIGPLKYGSVYQTKFGPAMYISMGIGAHDLLNVFIYLDKAGWDKIVNVKAEKHLADSMADYFKHNHTY